MNWMVTAVFRLRKRRMTSEAISVCFGEATLYFDPAENNHLPSRDQVKNDATHIRTVNVRAGNDQVLAKLEFAIFEVREIGV